MPHALPKPLFRLVRSIRSYMFCRRMRRRVRARGFSIITNNCIGGLLYKQLGMRFLSPTINIAIEDDEDYFAFCKDLRYYTACPLCDVSAEKKMPYPVGRLVPQDDAHRPVDLSFVHYPTFAEAADRWAARAGRINYEKLVFIYTSLPEADIPRNLLADFEALPGLKLSILQEPVEGVRHYCILPSWNRETHSQHLLDKLGMTGYRLFNLYDFAAFLNGEAPDAVDLRGVSPYGESGSESRR